MPFPDAKQQELIDCNRNALVLGGPGSGKTSTALYKAKYEIENLQDHQKILFLSFSNSAIHRIRETLKSNDLDFTRDEIRRLNIQTYHSFTMGIVRQFRAVVGIPGQTELYAPEQLQSDKTRFSINTNYGELRYCYRKLLQEGIMAFDLFAPVANKILKESQQISRMYQSLYPIIILDEFQDTDLSESRLIYKLAECSRIICLGDREQMIYTYRAGVDEGRIDEAIEILQPTRVDFGKLNYRSVGANVLAFGDNILGNTTSPVPPGIFMRTFQYPNQVSINLKRMVHDIKSRYRGSGNPTIGILTRTKKIAFKVSQELSKTTGQMNIPVRHDLIRDDNEQIYCGRILCRFLGHQTGSIYCTIGKLLSEFSDWYFYYNNATSTATAESIQRWKATLTGGVIPNNGLCNSLQEILLAMENTYTGNLNTDAAKVSELVHRYSNAHMTKLKSHMDHSLYLLDHKSLCQKSADKFELNGYYNGIYKDFHSHICTERIIYAQKSKSNVEVMNMDKVKGKEYDAVIIYHDGIFPMIPANAIEFNLKKLLRVSVTRARGLVYFFTHVDQNRELKWLLGVS